MLSAWPHRERRLLIVDPCFECEKQAQILSQNGWTVELAGLNDAVQYKFDIGMLRIQNGHLQHLDSVKQLIQHSGTEWIAALGREQTTENDFWGLIGEWFFDFHTLPFDAQRLHVALGRAHGMSRVRHINLDMRSGDENKLLIGNSPDIKSLLILLSKVAPTSSPVLIRGESGTGKELVARTIHQRSKRNSGPFIAVNCGAIALNLIQSELFGHEKGAFTGAHQRHIGRIEAANGGTLFLDEIGDLPLDMQTNLLRFLQEMTFERVGGREPIKANVRVLAATHADLEEAVAQGRFREDLYYRLNVLQVQTTPLRQRVEDIPLLVEYFSHLYANEIGRRPRPFSGAGIAAMITHAWPGNVRELANRVRRGQVLAEGRQIEPEDLGLITDNAGSNCLMSLEENLFLAERKAIDMALARCSWQMTRVAKTLGISRATLYRLLNKHNILPRQLPA
jgi:DNA-binding NtrC family response regulator